MCDKKIQNVVDIYDQIAAYELGLLKLYGAVMYGHNLYHVLGYTSSAAFRQSVKRKTVPIPTFKRSGYRMRFGRTRDIAKWLVLLGKDLDINLQAEKENDVT